MAVEIEKPSVSFTDEAQRVLQQSLLHLERRIRARAADHAIKSRGTPSEVTGSDIQKAYRELIDPDRPRDLFDDRMHNDRKYWRKSVDLRFVSMIYVWLGLFISICGALYPFIRTQLLNPSAKVGVIFALVGLCIVLTGLGMRSYLNYREAIRYRENIRRLTHGFSTEFRDKSD